MSEPVLVKAIPTQVMNELAAYGPIDLRQFIQSPDGGELRFIVGLKSGQALPAGVICTSDGQLTGIPAEGTQGNYDISIVAENEAGMVETEFVMSIKPSLAGSSAGFADRLKAQAWEALENNLPLPDLSELYNRPITAEEIYYLLERWGTLKIWDAFNLDAPGDCIPLQLEGASEHYHVYDRGSCLMACPKDLFSHERTIEDGLKTARAMAKEVYKRGWTIELAGIDKLVRGAWIELQHLSDRYGKAVEIVNFDPSLSDIKLYTTQTQEMRMGGVE